MKLTWGGYFMVQFLISGMHVCEKTGSTAERSTRREKLKCPYYPGAG